jgi:hypothetical protein
MKSMTRLKITEATAPTVIAWTPDAKPMAMARKM